MNREQIRHYIRQKREQLPKNTQLHAAKKVAEHIHTLPIFQQNLHLSFYIAHQGELDPRPIMELAWEKNKYCYLPCIEPIKKDTLLFAEFYRDNPLISNQYAILEPLLPHTRVITPEQLDVVFLPLVAFDKYGNRLGRGGGYYDKSFKFIQMQAHSKPLLVGLAYDFQRVRILPNKPWDVPLHSIVTESGYLQFHRP